MHEDDLTDRTVGKFFADNFSNKVIWCKEMGGWILYNGKSWKPDGNDTIGRFAFECVDKFRDLLIEKKKTGTVFTKFVKSLNNASGYKAFLECSKPYIGRSILEFDKDDFKFTCANGIYCLNGNKFNNFNSSDLITKISPVEYDINAKCELWEKFLDEIFLGDKEVIDYIQRVVGYSMTSDVRDQAMFILYGVGRNGKSKFLDTLSYIMGDYSTTAPSSTFIRKVNNGIPNDVAMLKGARMITASETSHNVDLDEELVKKLTGDEKITARFLNREFFEFKPTGKIFLATNHKPNIRGTNTGIWRRIHFIPFDLKLTEEQQDKELGDKLKLEASGILNWMIEGYNKWRKVGLVKPKKIIEATENYRSEEDDIGQFIKDNCILDNAKHIEVHNFKEVFRQKMGYLKGRKAITDYMRANGFFPGDGRIYVHGKQIRAYTKIGWKDDDEYTNNQETIEWLE